MVFRYFSFVWLLSLFVVHPTLAWTTLKPSSSATIGAQQKRLRDTALFASTEKNRPSSQQSRRDWFSSTITTAAGIILLPPPSYAASVGIKTSEAICDPTVSILKKGKRLIYLLGTAHISDVSAQLAAELVQDVRPDAVFIELDLKRVGPMVFRKAYVKRDRLEIPGPAGTVIVPNIIPVSSDIQIPKSQKAQQALITSLLDMIDFGGSPSVEQQEALASLFAGADLGAAAASAGIRNMYRNLSKQGFKPGQEFIVAVQEGQKIGADIILGDQDMGVTMQRLAQAAKMTDYSKLADNQLDNAISELAPESSEDYKSSMSDFIENLKTRDNVRKIMGQLRENAPYMVQAMLDERDAYMSAGLDILNDKVVTCAVMGIAHVDGVERNLQAKGWKKVNPRCPRK